MEIEVDGTATTARPPERATLTLRLGFESADKAQALQQTTELVHQVQSAVDALAARTPSPTTWSSVQPIRTRSWRPYNQDGEVMPQRFAAASVVKVKFRDFAALAAFTERWGAAPGVGVEDVDWALTEVTRQSLEGDVLARAVVVARTRAETIAAAAGTQVVQFARITHPPRGSETPTYGTARLAAAGGGSSPGIDLSPEDIEVRAAVRAVFETG